MVLGGIFSGIAGLLGVFAHFAIIFVVFGLMLDILKPVEAFKQIAIIVGTVIVLLMLPQIIFHAWSELSFLHKFVVAAIVVVACLVGWEKRK
ncbi:MAG: hypothetical protein P4K83_11680 [Terracidiphilus sp.]|nr:hypothetical protein [Terracidiphilus sp.]